jgi:hypothetical protein
LGYTGRQFYVNEKFKIPKLSLIFERSILICTFASMRKCKETFLSDKIIAGFGKTLSRGRSKVVEHSPRNRNVEGSSLPTNTARMRLIEKKRFLKYSSLSQLLAAK